MKKICHITTVHSLFDTRIFHKEAKTLASFGYDITLIVQHDKEEAIDDIKIVPLIKAKNRLERFLKINRLAYRLALIQKADIYHFHDPELLPWMVKLKKKTRAKVIYDVHEDYPKQILSKYWLPKILRSIVSKMFKFYEERMVKEFDLIITVGEDVKKRLGRSHPRIEVIKNFPILDNLKNTNIELFSKNIINLIYVGGLTKVRGIEEMVRTLKLLPNSVRLMLLGQFSPLDLDQQLKKIEGFEKVKYFGQVSPEKVSQYLFLADIGLICLWPIPNYYNTAEPTKLFEYMAAGLPVVASNFPLWKKIVEGNNCGVCVNPLEPKEIAKAVEYLIKHPVIAKKMGENGRKAVLEKYNWESESKKLLKIYEELAK
jgi:glycosyltransferase involved in cell wall biosynthesis